MCRAALVASLGILGAPDAAVAHDAVKAIVRFSGGDARLGMPCPVEVSVLAPPGLPIVRQIRHVSIVADMTGHAMLPVEADFTPDKVAGEYSGDIRFTMAGPWRLTVRVDLLNEQMWGTIDLPVRADSEAIDARPIRYVLELQDPIRPTVFPPGWTLGTAVALAAFLEVAAITLARRRRICRSAGL